MRRPREWNRGPLDSVLALGKVAKVDRERWFQDLTRAVVYSDDRQLEQRLTEIVRPMAVEEALRDVPYRNQNPTEMAEHLHGHNPILFGLLFDSADPFCLPLGHLRVCPRMDY